MGYKEDQQVSKPLLNSESHFRTLHDKPRTCKDLLFVLLFLACVAGMIVISGISFKKGDPTLLIPSDSREYIVKYGEKTAEGWFQDAVAQMKMDKDVIIGSVALSLVLGIVWVQLMKAFTKLFIYLSLFLGIAVVAGLGAYTLTVGHKQGEESIQIFGIVILAISGLLLLAVLFLRKKIALTCAMFSETCRGVQHNPILFVISVVVVGLFLGFAAFWTASFIYLYSIPGDNINTESNEPPKFDERIRNLMFFQVFAFFWISAFLSAVFQHVVAGAIATWYFSRSVTSPRSTGSPALTSLFRAFTTSFGSLAFGALLIAVVEFFNFLLQYVKKSNPKSKLVYYAASCVQCLLGCVEGIVRYVNKFAIVYIAMHGNSFCEGAKACSDMISRNFFSSVIMDVISGFVLFMGKVLFTALSVFLTVGIISHTDRSLSLVTVSMTAIISFIVLHIISHIVGVGINCVFICYLEDLEQNKGTNMYISPEVHEMLQDKVKEHSNKTSSV